MVVQRHLENSNHLARYAGLWEPYTGQPVLGLDGRTSLGTRHLGFGKHS